MNFDNLKSSAAADVRGKRVLVRADLNVPMKDGRVTDATRLERVAPGIKDLAQRGARVIVISHFGRPKGEVKPEFSLKPVADAMAGIVGQSVKFVGDCIGIETVEASKTLQDGQIAVFENLRFHKGEEANDKEFASQLAASGDIYVSEAFSAAHRAHASTEAIAQLLPSYAGPLMMEEIAALRSSVEEPDRPVAAVVGGAKVSTKIPVLTNLAAKVDKLIIGGGMANTFLLAQGVEIGKSLAEADMTNTALEIMKAAKQRSCEIVLPKDVVVAAEFAAGAPSQTVPTLQAPPDQMILDVGPESVQHYISVMSGCKTLLWNGPLGAFEIDPFGEGTFALARAAADLTQAGKIKSVAGGGDTVAALNAAGATPNFSYVSTAGGAFLEWLEGKQLPGIVALTKG